MDSSFGETSIISQASFSMEDDIPTQWSSDLREGLATMDISYKEMKDSQLPAIYALYNYLSYPLNHILSKFFIHTQAANVYLCESSMIPLIMDEESLLKELTKRNVYYKETDSRDVLVHLLERDILLKSQRTEYPYFLYRIKTFFFGLWCEKSDCF